MAAPAISELIQVFLDYVDTFDVGDRDLRSKVSLKRTHSQRVCDEIASLATELAFDATVVDLARVAGLLHDVGRFEQYYRFRTFSDLKSVDHGSLGAAIVRQTGILSGFSKADQTRILSAIRFHNRPAIPTEAYRDRLMLQLTQLLRDADKLDIMRIFTGQLHPADQANDGSWPCHADTGVSAAVVDCMLRKQIVPVERVRTRSDLTLMRTSWVFDMNFTPTWKRFLQRGYLKALERRVPQTSGVVCAFQTVHEFIQFQLASHDVDFLVGAG